MADLVIAPGDHLHYADSVGWYFFTDFSEYTTGNALSDWTERWDTANVSNTVQAASWTYKLGKKLFIDNNSDSRKLLSWDDLDNYDNENVDQLVLYKPSTLPTSPLRLIARGSGASASENAYLCQLGTSLFMISKYVAGASTNIKTETVSLTANNYYWIRFRVNGSSVKAKVWSYDTPEPYDWDIDETDTGVTGNGWCGFGNYSTYDTYIYYYAATLGGTASPEIPATYDGISRFGCIFPFANFLNAGLNSTRLMGGIFNSDVEHHLTGASIYCHATHTSQIRVAVYSGGDLSTGPDGAELLADLGLTSGSDTAQWIEVSCSPVLIPQNKPLWIAMKGNDTGFDFTYTANAITGANFQNAKGRYSSSVVSTDEAVAYPDPWPADSGAFADFWYGMRIKIAGPSTTLVIADNHLEHYADNVLINLLEVSEPYHLHVVDPDPIALTRVHVLAVSPCDHLNVPDPIALTQTHNLTVSPCDHLHVVDPDPITIVVILPTQEAYHDHFVDPDPIALTQIHNLTVQEAHHLVVDDQFYFIFDLLVAVDNDHLHVVDPDPLYLCLHLTVQETYHSHFVDPDPLALTQVHELAVNEANHLLIDDQFYFILPLLVALDNFHLNVPDPIALTQEHELAVNEAYHDHVVDGLIALIEVIDLLMAQAWSEHYADNVALCPHLVIAETHHDHYTNALSLAAWLVVSESWHELTTDPIALTQDHALSVQDAFHGHVADLADLIEVLALVVSKSFHDHLADTLSLGVHITIQEAYHEHYADLLPLTLPLLLADTFHSLQDDFLSFEQRHFLEIAGTAHNTSYNYHVMTSDEMRWGYLVADLGTLSIIDVTPDRTFEDKTALRSFKSIPETRDIKNVTVYRSMRKAA